MSDPTTRLSVESVTVGDTHLRAVVRVDPPSALTTAAHPAAAEALLESLPGLRRHRCESGKAHGFERELADTELPHVLEHTTLELMVLAGSPRTLSGSTTWDFARDGRGVFRVEIEYDDDLVALGALRAATALVNSALCDGPVHDIASVVADLSSLRATGAD